MAVINISNLPAPEAVEEISFEQILDEMQNELIALDPDLKTVIQLESEPVNKLLEVVAYREMIARQRSNYRIKRLFLAYAQGSDLDHIGVTYFFTQRKEGERDDDYRRRLTLAPDTYSTAGARDAYVYHALSADANVRDATATSPEATKVTVAILSRQGNGAASSQLIEKVDNVLSADYVRPLTDKVTVISAEVSQYQVNAQISIKEGPDSEVVRLSAQKSAEKFVAEHHQLGVDIWREALIAALYVEGVERVFLISPDDDIRCNGTQAGYCTKVVVSLHD